MDDQIRVTRHDAIATVTLSNPAKLNAVTAAMWRELKAAMDACAADDSLRCVILRGAGSEALAAGGDIEEFLALRDTLERARTYHEDWVAPALRAVRDCPHPTLARIHGACIGGGLEISCACDLRLCDHGARFGVPISRLGFSMAPAELALVLEVAGPATALELLLEGRLLSAAEAHARGLVHRVLAEDELEDEVLATARRIAAGAPRVARAHKRLVRRLTRGTALDEAEVIASYAWLDTDDYREGLRAFLEKRPPQFRGR